MNADGGGRGAGPAPRGTTPVLRFNDLATAFPDGLPFQPWAKELRDKRNAEESKNNPDAHCLPMGFAQFHAHPYPRKMLHNPEQLTIFYEVNYGLREIFTDGRPLPSDPQPTWYGYSIGKWEGDTLVVETMGLRGSETSALDGWLDVVGSPYTDAVKTIERFRRPNYGTLEIDLTVDDPKAYTRPWTVRVNQRIQPGMQMIEFICLENNNFTKYLTGEQIREQQARDKK
jgi:hypothetical protein